MINWEKITQETIFERTKKYLLCDDERCVPVRWDEELKELMMNNGRWVNMTYDAFDYQDEEIREFFTHYIELNLP